MSHRSQPLLPQDLQRLSRQMQFRTKQNKFLSKLKKLTSPQTSLKDKSFQMTTQSSTHKETRR